MFCEKCGRVLEEGKAFCKNCGAPAPKLGGTGAQPGPAEAAGPAATWPGPPPPPPGAPPVPGYSAGGQPPLGPPSRKGRGGLIGGIAVATIVVLAGIGVGVYFGFFHDGDEPVRTSTTKVSSTSTTGDATDTTSGPATSTGSQTDATVSGTSTIQTVPGLDTTTSGSSAAGSGTIDPTKTSEGRYLAAAENLVHELEYDDGRIPELAKEINNTAPKAPTWVRDELSTMLGSLDMLNVELVVPDVPAAFQDSHYWLGEAVTHMGNRIYATMQGVEIMWSTGKVSSANPYFDEGRVERDAYREAMGKYYEFLPVD